MGLATRSSNLADSVYSLTADGSVFDVALLHPGEFRLYFTDDSGTAAIVDKDSDLQLAREYGQMLLALLEQERIAADARLLEAEDQLAHKSGQ